jgi:hypothetical protein
VKGDPLHIVTSEAFAAEKLDHRRSEHGGRSRSPSFEAAA